MELDSREALATPERRSTTVKPLSHAAQLIGHAEQGDDDKPVGLFVEEQLHESLNEPRSRSGLTIDDYDSILDSSSWATALTNGNGLRRFLHAGKVGCA